MFIVRGPNLAKAHKHASTQESETHRHRGTRTQALKPTLPCCMFVAHWFVMR